MIIKLNKNAQLLIELFIILTCYLVCIIYVFKIKFYLLLLN